MPKVKRALISVYDKRGMVEFAQKLRKLDITLIASGGTAKELRNHNIECELISDIIDFPEILGGRVKTLHPKIFGGILSDKENRSHVQDLNDNAIQKTDMIVVNLYPFREEVVEKNLSLQKAVEFIDIGGSALIRAAAKNFRQCVSVTSPDHYINIIKLLKSNDNYIEENQSFEYARLAFSYTFQYDKMIYDYFSSLDKSVEEMPSSIDFITKKYMTLRYGENSHQKAGLYVEDAFRERTEAYQQLHGKELSFNNLIDIDTAMESSHAFEEPAAVILKHTNPCGSAIGDNLLGAYTKALACDPVSAFGGIVGFNRKVDLAVAEELSKIFLEVIVAPDFDDDALSKLTKKKNLRLIKLNKDILEKKRYPYDIRLTGLGFLVQEKDFTEEDFSDFKVVSEREPTGEEMKALKFGWKIVRFIKSNAIVFSSTDRSLGVGAGQMSRVDSVEIAQMKAKNAGLLLKNSVLASDAFFPFRDGIDKAHEAGATAIIQPGGSIRDQEVIDAVNEHNMSMIFTGRRHFRH